MYFDIGQQIIYLQINIFFTENVTKPNEVTQYEVILGVHLYFFIYFNT